MKAHELAQKLLDGPNLDVMFEPFGSGTVLSNVEEYKLRTLDEEDTYVCVAAKDLLGETVVVLQGGIQ